ncbi:MAG: photosystem II cytochrome c-550 [Cyanobacteriota bacterium]|nr:photosystem II cytochrome c-550 [Cyanobacteriota bacterium]
MFSKPFPFQKLAACLLATVLLLVSSAFSPVLAASSTYEVALNETETYTLTVRELNQGKKLFGAACGQCHIGGVTYTNPDVGLKLEELELATPRRDTIAAIIDYLENPTTYDGSESLLEYHPNTQLTSVYPKMRNLSKEDMKLIAGYILYEAKNLPGWGGTKNETHSDLSQYL